jgi:hypothetical protein
MLLCNIGFTLIFDHQHPPGATRLGRLGSHTMNRNSLVITAVMLLAALSAASGVEAHPAVAGTAPASVGIDPNTFIVAHPAGLALVHRHANHEHPAVSVQREVKGLDPNLFIVQPPVSAHWALVSEPAAQFAALR